MRLSDAYFTVLACSTFLLTGCGVSSNSLHQTAPSAAFAGKVFGGQQPIKGSTVTVWVAGTSGYGAGATALSTTTTDDTGNFSFADNAYTCPYTGAPMYVTAAGGDSGGGDNDAIVLAAGLGLCSSAHSAVVNINEVTTAMTALAMGHFFTTTLGDAPTTDLFGGKAAGSGIYNTGLVMADAYTIPNFVSLPLGNVRTNLAAGTVLESAKLYSMANVLAACVNSTDASSTACETLFTDTTTPAGKKPTDTLQAAVQMVLYPYQNVTDLYQLSSTTPPFAGLASAPNDWTVGVSYTSSAFGLQINNTHTVTNLDIDTTGNIYFPTDTTSAHGIGVFHPATGLFEGPLATTLVHPQYVAVTEQNLVYASDLGASQIVSLNPSASNATSTIATTGYIGPLVAGYHSGSSVPDVLYFTGGVTTGPGAILYQLNSGTISQDSTYSAAPAYLAIWGGEYPYNVEAAEGTNEEYTVGAPDNLPPQQDNTTSTTSLPGGLAMAHGAAATFMVASSLNQVCYVFACGSAPIALSTPIGIATDGDDNLWVANSGNASVTTFAYDNSVPTVVKTSTVPYLHNSANGGTFTRPYGIAIDRSGNVWISNVGCVTTDGTACTTGSYVLSELIGAAAPTMTPLADSTYFDHAGSRP